jgi:hypothetical protein
MVTTGRLRLSVTHLQALVLAVSAQWYRKAAVEGDAVVDSAGVR